MSEHGCIAVYDSGIGGLSVAREVVRRLPDEPLLYIADQAHVPYGVRSLAEVRDLAEGVADYAVRRGAKLIVLACNTASAAALHELRAMRPDLPFVGMEPAVKPAAEQTLTGRVAVLATPATFQGKLYESVVERFAEGVTVLRQPCPGLVEAIEANDLYAARELLVAWLLPLRRQGIDRLVLACTHYPLVIDLIRELAGEEIVVIDPAPAIARQVERVLDRHDLRRAADGSPVVHHFVTTTTDLPRFAEQVDRHLPLPQEARSMQRAHWHNRRLQDASSVPGRLDLSRLETWAQEQGLSEE